MKVSEFAAGKLKKCNVPLLTRDGAAARDNVGPGRRNRDVVASARDRARRPVRGESERTNIFEARGSEAMAAINWENPVNGDWDGTRGWIVQNQREKTGSGGRLRRRRRASSVEPIAARLKMVRLPDKTT
ncbi:MAG TPA: hypothetical protein VHY09_10750 [Candidatus Methylacidiphilales bacterium]|nr:hypothetical protein [Candidatus Methylacidiphilales bacterium]